MQKTLAMVLITILCCTTAQASRNLDTLSSELLSRAQAWQDKQRDDLALQALEKLLHIYPQHPDALAQLAKIQLRNKQISTAQQTLQRLRAISPSNTVIKQLETELRLSSVDSDKWQAAQQHRRTAQDLMNVARTRTGKARQQLETQAQQEVAQALGLLRSFTPNGELSDDIALEYWQTSNILDKNWQTVLQGLKKLVAEQPNNPKYRLSLAQHLASRSPVSHNTIRTLAEFSHIPVYARSARNSWRSALLRLPAQSSSLALIEEYLNADAGDSAMQEWYLQIKRQMQQWRRLATDPAYQARNNGITLLNKNEIVEAEEQLLQAYISRPDDAEVSGNLGLLQLRQDNHSNALAYFKQAARFAPKPQLDKWQQLQKTARYWGLLRQANDAQAAHEPALAEQLLFAAQRLDQQQAQSFIALAQLYRNQQEHTLAEFNYQQALKLQGNHPAALQGLIDLYLQTGREQQAQLLIAQLPAQQQQSLQLALQNQQQAKQREQANLLRKQADTASSPLQAQQLLEQAITLTPDNPWLRFDLAKLYAKQQPERALALFEMQPQDSETLYAYALIQSALDMPAPALQTLEKIPEAQLSNNMRQLKQQLWFATHTQQVLALQAQGQRDAAIQRLDEIQNKLGKDAEFILPIASSRIKLQQYALAQQLLNDLPITSLAVAQQLQRAELLNTIATNDTAANHETELSKQLSQITLLSDLSAEQQTQLHELQQRQILRQAKRYRHNGQLQQALTLLEPLEQSASLSSSHKLELVDFLIDAKQLQRAQPIILALLEGNPQDAQTLGYAATVAEHNLQLISAKNYYQQALQAPQQTLPDYLKSRYQQHLERLLTQTSPWISVANDNRHRSGTLGLSQLNSKEFTLEWKPAWQPNKNYFLRTDFVSLDAGTLALGEQRFGTQRVHGSNITAIPQNAQGLALSAGVQYPNWRIDIGTSPLGFPVSNLLGGVLYQGELNQYSYSINASRRSVTSSLLSYAGTTDPSTGQVWGGVTETGIRLGLSKDDGGFIGTWGTLSLQQLSGKNVQDNVRQQFMAGAYWRTINEENRLLSLGITTRIESFSKNAGEFSFGHGGYYSPAQTLAISFPIRYSARQDRLSYLIKGALSSSWTRSQDAAYYPTSTTLQQLAQANYSAGSSSHSLGYSLNGSMEYKLDKPLYIGASLELERSPDYAPNRLLLYMRYALDPNVNKAVSLPPNPVIPTSQY